MTGIKIRPASVEDAQALSELGGRTFSDKFGHLYAPEDLSQFLKESHSAEGYIRALNDGAIRIWVGEAETGALAGYGVAGPCDLPVDDCPDGAMEISRLYVDAPYQGEGLGRLLMDEMIAWIDRDGKAPLYLSVYKFNDGAQRFYERYGFGLLKEYKYRVGTHYDPEYLFVRR